MLETVPSRYHQKELLATRWLGSSLFCQPALSLPTASACNNNAFRWCAEDIVSRLMWTSQQAVFLATTCQFAHARRYIATGIRCAALSHTAHGTGEAHGFANDRARS